MNVERWVAARQVYWQKLEELLKQIEKRGLPSLSREQLQTLGRLYRSAASDLSRARAMTIGPDIIFYLNNLVVKGHNQVYQSPRSRWRDLRHFLLITFPSVYRKNIIYVIVSFLLFLIPLAGTWSAILKNPEFAQLEMQPGQAIVPDTLWSYVEKKQMWTDELQHESPAGSSFIATNNIRVSLLEFALGSTFGLGTIYILITNGISIGGAFAACHLHHMLHRLIAFVAPHGVFELSAIFIAGGAGLMLGKGMLFPGLLKRTDAMKRMAKEASILFLGTVPLLLIAGTIEGFISPRTDISQEYKFAVSFSTLIMLMLYLIYPWKNLESKDLKEEDKSQTVRTKPA